jgi:hypothetical protein
MKKFTILLLCFGFLAANATSWRVNNNPAIDADFSTFEAAVAGASAGDTLYIEGTPFSYGTQVLDKRLVLIGPGYYLTENDSTQVSSNEAIFKIFTIDTLASGSSIYGIVFEWYAEINGSNVVFSRNHVATASYETIYIGEDNPVNNCVVTQNYCGSISSSSYHPSLNILISNNYVEEQITLYDNASCVLFNNVVKNRVSVYNSIVKNNIIYNAASYQGFMENENNIFEYNMANIATIPPGTGNVTDIDPLEVFADYDGSLGYSTDGKWQLKEGSPAIGAGENGTDCGIFGGTSPYVLSGLPAVPHIYEAIVPTSGSAASGLPVTIKVKSQN